MILGRRAVPDEEDAAVVETAAPAPAERSHPLALWAILYALGGFCALSLEMLWFRITDVALKATSFTFGTVLCVYLLGMAAGTFAGVPLAPRIRDPLRAFLRCQAAILIWAAAAVVLLATLPSGVPPMPALLEYWSGPRPFNLGVDWRVGMLLLLYAGLPVLLYGVPTVLMGFSFTLLQRAVHDDPRTSGRKVGLLQAANIAGCVAGSLAVGLGALGWWGTTGTLRALLRRRPGVRGRAGRRPPPGLGRRPAGGGAGRARGLRCRARKRCGCACTRSAPTAAWSRRTRRAWPRSSPAAGAGACG